MTNFRVTSESPATRCEVCHQADCLDVTTGVCSRCGGIDPVMESRSRPRRWAGRESGWNAGGWGLQIVLPIFLFGFMISIGLGGAFTRTKRIQRPPILPVSVTADPQLEFPIPPINTQKADPPKTGVVLTCDPAGHAVELSIPSVPARTRGKMQTVRGIISGGDFSTNYANSEKPETVWQLIVHDETRRRHWFELPTGVFESLAGRERAALDEGLIAGNRVTVEFVPESNLHPLVLKRIRFEGRDLKRLKEMYGGTDPGSFLSGFHSWVSFGVDQKERGGFLFRNLSCGFYDLPKLKVSGIVGERCREQGKSGRAGFLLKTEGNREIGIFYDMSEVFLSTAHTAEESRRVVPGKYVTVEARTLPNGSNIAETIEVHSANPLVR